jgi:hypothetical protein
MRWADLVLAYVRVLIWPVVIIALLFFNRQVRTILSRLAERIKDLRSVKGFGAEATFDPDQTMVEARKEIDKASEPAPVEPTTESVPEIDQQIPRWTRKAATQFWTERILPTPESLADSAQNSPQTTIVAAWQQLDDVVAILYQQLNLERLPPGAGTVTQVAAICSVFAEAHVLDNANSILEAVTRLAHLRRSVENRVVTKLEAYDFADSVLQIRNFLTDAYGRLPEAPADG